MISIIIPTYNEEEGIGKLISYLKRYAATETEIIVSDGGSDDATNKIAENAGALVFNSPDKGRAAQMNNGAAKATGDIFYFVHADSFPPVTFCNDIREAIKKGFAFGRYQTRFDSHKFLLKLNAFFTRFDLFACYGGDQTLFITRDLFTQLKGFDASMRIMEDYEIVVRAKQIAEYCILPGKALVSARKYATNSWWQIQKANYTIVKMYRQGASQEAMIQRYKEMLVYR